jgi:cobalt-zinc-cadmium efflux system membrane fusion protein
VNRPALRMLHLSLWLCVGALLMTACDRLGLGAPRQESHSASSQPEADEKTAQITVWSDRVEIFLEHRRRDGPLTYIFQQGTTPPITHVEPIPERAGIYNPALTLPQPGEWSVTLQMPLAGQDHRVALSPVLVFASRAEAKQAPEPPAPEGITFLKEQQWKILTQTAPVQQHPVTERLRLAGVVAVRSGHKAAVTSHIAGHLVPPPGAALPALGSRVRAGQVLAMVQPHVAGTELVTFLSTQRQIQTMDVELTVKAAEAEAETIRARAALTQAEQALRRVRTLREHNAKSARDLEEAELAQRKAEADVTAAEALKKTYDRARKQLAERPRAVELGRELPAVELQAPIAGVITAVNATVGAHVQPTEALFTLLNTETVFIEAQLPEADLGRLGSSSGATYETPAAPDTFVPMLGAGGGRLVALGSTVDAKTRTVPLVYEVPNPDGRLRISMALNVYVETAHSADALVVPVTALVEEDGRSIAFVQVAGETFVKRDLILGMRDGSFVQVLAGLAAGERVVTKGAYAIRLASVSATLPAHGHAH